jgi:hypothetical protein
MPTSPPRAARFFFLAIGAAILATASSLSQGAQPPPASIFFKKPEAATMADALARGDANAGLMGRAKGVDINIKGVGGTRPIHYVTRYANDLSMGSLRSMANLGADVSATDDEGNTPLGLAAARSSGIAVQILLGFSANPKTPSAGKLPIQIAFENGNRAAFETLALYGPLQGPTYSHGSAGADLASMGLFEWDLWLATKGLIAWRTESESFWRSTCTSSNEFASQLLSVLARQGAPGARCGR